MLAQRISPGEVEDLASQLPGPLRPTPTSDHLADAVSGGELNQILSQLPSGYAVLFGKADLAG